MVTAVGLDLSLTGSGVAVSRALTGPDRLCTLRKVGEKGITNLPVAEQIGAINGLINRIEDVVALAGDDHPIFVSVEAPDNAQSYGGVTERAVMWWKTVELAMTYATVIWMPTSAQVKIYATGNGLSDKKAVIAAVAEHWPWWQPGRDDNLADAAVMAELTLALAGEPSVDLPKTHTRALANIRSITDPPSRVLKKERR